MPIEYLMWAPLVVLSLILYLTLAAAALCSLAGSSWVSRSARRAWMLVVVLLPVAGSILWFAASHRRTLAFPTDYGENPPTPDTPDVADTPDAAGTPDVPDAPEEPVVLLDVHER
ncbi:PLD nuclease N-terminal domain-containing protein [Arthrobacter gengyunqii]|uniref:PLD nuclease N-terminal domain-containing protein n=1 Tax=Arthrobacter gengyunqii TaxID=2886940 RepID=A0A9X1LZU4_9MICC|nr:PLD nuclease N-terminal domain-containing protein [Arthrobacter gengyunqii]MCC3265870.1 PLD nuclease N-terminal domain-containing protein [Arthrobacter gengyunqii]MCC3268626.1 PLD nuclease N-terminal domain-containing protein [Arthrobacter gengyunqii]UOY96014.1 PLD nuclease N-terminal domain-containing protein [Arthrobacter gengyunqii]